MTIDHSLQTGRNCWRIAKATRASVIVDADDYFRLCRAAMCHAKHQIILIGWEFDARIRLVHEGADDAPSTVGAFIDWLVANRPDLSVHILRWDAGAVKGMLQPRTVATVLRWRLHPRIHIKLDSMHPIGGSHHQKIVVIDDMMAFCGGIDMTSERWDTRDHLEDDPGRTDPSDKPYKPWHDATTALAGPVAATLGELCRMRWTRAGGKPFDAPPPREPFWPDELPTQFENVDVAVSRTIPEMDGVDPVFEIETLYLDLIARAKRWIYAESQYFASRKIAEAMAARLEEPDGPEIVIINPVKAEGWLEPIAMDSARARLVQAMRDRDPHGRLRIYHAMTATGSPIYVHAKVTIIDDMILRIGSSNFNNRSMRLDSECDVTIDATLDTNDDLAPTIAAIRNDLIAEHCGCTAQQVDDATTSGGSLIAAIDSLCGRPRTLRPYRLPDLTETEEWLADNEVLDPECPDEMFEPIAMHHGLLSKLRGR